MHFTGHELNHLLSVYGYWAVMLFVALEAIGIPIPGETMLIAASIYAGTTHDLDITLVIGAGTQSSPARRRRSTNSRPLRLSPSATSDS